MPLLCTNGKTVFFSHIPKTGGTSVQNYLLNRFGPLLMLGRNHPDPRGRSVITSAAHFSALDLEELLPENLAWSFAIVREPAERLKSEYRFQQGKSRASQLSFSTWLRVMISAARREPRIYENHIRPQVDFLPKGAVAFRLEDGIDAFIPHLDEIVGKKNENIKIEHLLTSKALPITLTRQDARIISEYYAEDYKRFGYPKIESSELASDQWSTIRGLIAKLLGHAIVLHQHRIWLKL